MVVLTGMAEVAVQRSICQPTAWKDTEAKSQASFWISDIFIEKFSCTAIKIFLKNQPQHILQNKKNCGANWFSVIPVKALSRIAPKWYFPDTELWCDKAGELSIISQGRGVHYDVTRQGSLLWCHKAGKFIMSQGRGVSEYPRLITTGNDDRGLLTIYNIGPAAARSSNWNVCPIHWDMERWTTPSSGQKQSATSCTF